MAKIAWLRYLQGAGLRIAKNLPSQHWQHWWAVDLYQRLSYACVADKALFLKPVTSTGSDGLKAKTRWTGSRTQRDQTRCVKAR